MTAFLEAAPRRRGAAPRRAARLAARRAWATRRRRTSGTAPTLPRASRGQRRASSTRRRASSRRAAISPRCARSWARRRSCRSPQAGPALEQRGLTALGLRRPAGDADDRARRASGSPAIPALVDDGDSVSLALLDTRDAADASTRAGVVRLLAHRAASDALARYEKGGAGLRAGGAAAEDGDPDRPAAGRRAGRRLRPRVPRRRSAAAHRAGVRRAGEARADAAARGRRRRLPAARGRSPTEHHALAQRLAGAAAGARPRLAAEVRAQRDALVYPGFFARDALGAARARCRAT